MDNSDARELNKTINSLLDEQDYSQAKQILALALKSFSEQEEKDLYLYAEIAGSLITLGSESYDEEAVKQGLQMFESNK